MSTEWELAFLSTVIIFCLICSLNTSHGDQNPSFFSCWRLSINFFKIDISAAFHHTVWWGTHMEIILKFLSVSFYHCHCCRRGTCVWFWWQIAKPESKEMDSTYFVYCFQTLKLNSIEYLRFNDCYVKVNKEHMLWHSETQLDTDCFTVSQ